MDTVSAKFHTGSFRPLSNIAKNISTLRTIRISISQKSLFLLFFIDVYKKYDIEGICFKWSKIGSHPFCFEFLSFPNIQINLGIINLNLFYQRRKYVHEEKCLYTITSSSCKY